MSQSTIYQWIAKITGFQARLEPSDQLHLEHGQL